MNAVRAAIYCRVSTDEQAERGTSLADQQARCEAHCRSESWTVAGTFVDEGISGATTERPALTRLMAAARHGELDRVVVTDPDRLSRDLVDGLTIERDLTGCGIEVTYLIQPTMGTLERQIRGVIAEEERRKIRDRTSRGLRAVAAAGHWPGGPPPYGYRIERRDGEHSNLVVRDDEAATIRRMIEALVDRRLTTSQLAAELNNDRVPTAATGRRVSNAGTPRWTHRRVRDVLSAARGISGRLTYTTSTGDYEIDLPAIVSDARHQQLRDRLGETSTGRNATKKKHTFLLARRVTSECGHPMHSYCRPDGTSRVYRRSMSTADSGPDRCECGRASADAIEHAAWTTVATELTDPARLQQLAGLAANTPADDGSGDLDMLERKIRRLETATGSTISELLADGADPAAVRSATHELEAQLAALRTQRTQVLHWAAARADQAAQIDRITRLAESARTAIEHPTPALKARIVELLDLRVSVTGHIPCATCDGRGLVADAAAHGDNRRRSTGAICPACRRYRAIATIEIRGLLPTVDHLPENPDTAGTPFTLRSVA